MRNKIMCDSLFRKDIFAKQNLEVMLPIEKV